MEIGNRRNGNESETTKRERKRVFRIASHFLRCMEVGLCTHVELES